MNEPHLIDSALASRWHASGLKLLHLAGRALLPLVQGGMGVGVSAHRLAGSVAAQGAVGTISSIGLRLAAALRGEIDKGQFFRGAGALPFGERIATVRALIERLLTPGIALGTA